MADTLKVKAGSNGPVRMEGFPRREFDKTGAELHLIGDQLVEVPNTRYYRKRLEMGDLVRADAPMKEE